MPPNNQGNATPKYNRNDDGEQPAKDGVANEGDLDLYTAQSIAELEDGYLAFAGQRDDGFYADIQAVFDLLKLRAPGQAVDSQGGFNVHTIALNIPIEELGGDQQIVGVYATTSRRRVKILGPGDDAKLGDFVQVARQGNPLFNEGLVAIKDKDLYSRTSPEVDASLFRKYALTPELAALINALVFGSNVAPTTNRTDIAGIFIPDLIKVDLSTGPARLAGGGAEPSDQSGRRRLLAPEHLRRRHADQLGAGRLRQRHRAGRMAERPPLRRRRARHRRDRAHQRSAREPADHRRSGGRQRGQQRHRLQQGVPVRGDAVERPHPHSLSDRCRRSRSTAGPAAAGSAALRSRSSGSSLTATVLRAHDPGLSSLDVSVSGAAISVSLSIAAADLALVAPGREADARRQLSELARDAVRLSVDGEALPSVDRRRLG